MQYNNFSSYAFFYLIQILLIFATFGEDNLENCPEDISNKCRQASNCDECLKIDTCCVWCFESSLNIIEKACDLRKNVESFCNKSYIEGNTPSSSKPTEDKKFMDYLEDEVSVQFKPQKLNVTLKEGLPINITVQFRLANDYPLDLYYLLDYSYSMRSHVKELKTLSEGLPQTLFNLTKNYKIAFGTFMEKIALPFSITNKEEFKEVCDTGVKEETQYLNCDELGHLFKHIMNFETDVNKLINEVKKLQLSGNNDAPEAALEAVDQVINCKKIINWRENSRKMIVIATSGTLKLAGDGVLAGTVKNPYVEREKCHLDSEGNHIRPLTYDYPSLEEIHYLLDKEKTKIIFAIQKDDFLYSYYSKLQKTALENVILISNLSVNDNEIIQKVLTEGYNNFAQRVSIFIDTSQHDELEIEYYAKCGRRNKMVKGSTCELSDSNINDLLTFNISLTLKKKPTNLNGATVYVEETSIRDKVELNLNYISAKCKCEGQAKSLENGNGEQRCNQIICNEGWGGENCSVNCEHASISDCRIDENARICSGNGNCKCSQCECFYSYAGKYCENRCPINRANRRICSGNGICTSDGCKCDKNFNGTDCSCDLRTTNCLANGKICSGHGKCECNRCNCDWNYGGHFCERISNRFCTFYKNVAENKDIWQNKTQYQGVYIHNNLENKDGPQNVNECNKRMCETIDNEGCSVEFCGELENEQIKLFIMKRSCYYSAQTKIGFGIFLAFGFTILIGVMIILLQKYLRDKREYEKFALETSNAFSTSAQENPTYKDPNTRIINPTYKKRI